MDEEAMRHNEIGDAIVAAIVNLDVAIDLLMSPKTDWESLICDELQSLNRRLTISGLALGVNVPENG